MIRSVVNYIAAMPERPFFYQYEPPSGQPARNTRGDRQPMAIEDARALRPPPSLDVEGFALVEQRTAVENLYDPKAVQEVYYREIEALVRASTGADRVLAFDHNVRSTPKAERDEDGAQKPVRFAHNDYTERSGPQRVRDLLPTDEAERRLARRFAVINVWKPIRGPIEEAPLAFCDARTIAAEDFVPSDLRYRERSGEVYSLTHRPTHRWFYFPAMEAHEALLLKCYDSDSNRARFTAHTAVDDPTSPPSPRPRESIEVRTLAFF